MSPVARRELIEKPVPPSLATPTLLSTLHEDFGTVMMRQPNICHVSPLPSRPPESNAFLMDPNASTLAPSTEPWHWFEVKEKVILWGTTQFISALQRTPDGYNTLVDHPLGLVMRGRTWLRRGAGNETPEARLLCDEVEFEPRSLLVRALMWFIVGSWYRAHAAMLEQVLRHAGGQCTQRCKRPRYVGCYIMQASGTDIGFGAGEGKGE